MSWRTVVITKPSKLDLRLGYLTIRDSEETVKIHIKEIAILIIENIQTSITAALMNELAKSKITVVFCDEKHNPSIELCSLYGSHDCSSKLRNQIKWSDEVKQMTWNFMMQQTERDMPQRFILMQCLEKAFPVLKKLQQMPL